MNAAGRKPSLNLFPKNRAYGIAYNPVHYPSALLGINEIGYGPEKISEGYAALIDRIRAVMPDAEIYVMAITPVTWQKSAQGNFNMPTIRKVNAALYEMCREKDCWYLDCCELLCDESGFLPERYAGWDGSPHLAVEAYQAWADLIRTYY